MKEILILLAVLILAIAVYAMPTPDRITTPEEALHAQGYTAVQIGSPSLAGCFDDEKSGYIWQALNDRGQKQGGTICGHASAGDMYWRVILR